MSKSQISLKLMTYNIHSGKDQKGKYTLFEMLKYIKKCSPDILAIQEINENKIRGYQVSKLTKHYNDNYHFASNVKIGGGDYGNVTFSLYNIIKKEDIILPSLKEQRGLLKTTIRIKNRDITIFNTHLGLNYIERKQQFHIVEQEIKKVKQPYIIMGDFNTTDINLEKSLYRDIAVWKDKESLPTLINSTKRIDFILASKNINILNYNVAFIPFSDHYPVIGHVIL